jgi:flagellar basal body P-ring formation protein FlgA
VDAPPRFNRTRSLAVCAWHVASTAAVWAALGLGAVARAAGPVVPANQAEQAAPAVVAELEQQVRQFTLEAGAAPGLRLEVQVGSLDSRLRLAPCARVEPYLPAGTRLWGRTRIGLRCAQGGTPWNVYLPLTVKVFGRGLTAAAALPAGATLTATDLRAGEVDLADAAAPLLNPEAAVGRTLARPLTAGQTLHQGDLRARQWFAAGDTVQVTAIGSGFRVSGEGQALGPGLEGQPARVRTESGRVVVGMPVAERRLEVSL